MEESERLRAHEDRLAQLLHHNPQRGAGAQGTPHVKVPLLKIPMLKEGEDLDDFIVHFEHICEVSGIPAIHRAAHLAGALSGKAREAFNVMPDKTDYDAIIRDLRKYFHLTPEAYRRKFRDLRKSGTESFPQFAVRLSRSLGYWERMSGSALRDLVLIEQFLACVPEDIGTYVREQKCTTLTTVGLAAETYAEARPGKRGGIPGVGNSGQPHRDSRPSPKDDSARRGTRSHSEGGPPRRGGAPQQGPGRGNCYTCGRPGHIARDCPSRRPNFGGAPPKTS